MPCPQLKRRSPSRSNMSLLKILFLLFLTLAILVVVLERFGKPMSQSKQAKLSRWGVFLMFGLMVSMVIKEFF